MEKLEWCGYPRVKNIEDMLICFNRIDKHNRQTDIAAMNECIEHKLLSLSLSYNVHNLHTYLYNLIPFNPTPRSMSSSPAVTLS